MRITGFIPVRTSSVKRAGTSSSSVSFEDALANAGGVSGGAAVGETASAAPVDAMLALQEISDEESKRKILVKQGETSLEALENLRRALLMGTLPVEVLQNLEQVVARQRLATADPRLSAILDDIELRAAVELAKLEVAVRNRESI